MHRGHKRAATDQGRQELSRRDPTALRVQEATATIELIVKQEFIQSLAFFRDETRGLGLLTRGEMEQSLD